MEKCIKFMLIFLRIETQIKNLTVYILEYSLRHKIKMYFIIIYYLLFEVINS